MKRYSLIALILAVATGCSYAIQIRLISTAPYQPGFELSKPFFSKPIGSVYIEDFSVVQKIDGKWDYKNPIWSVAREEGEKKRLKKIHYGVVPEGFKVVAQNEKLKMNHAYLAIAFGGGGRGSVEFIIKYDGEVQEAKGDR